MVRVGIVGLGYWGKVLARYFANADGVDLLACADVNQEGLETHSFSPVCSSMTTSDLLRLRDIEAVVIATPAETHFDIAKAALFAGKHVWIEKPVAQTTEQALELASLARRQQRILFVDHTYVYSDHIAHIRQVFEKCGIGDPKSYHSTRVNNGLPRSDASIFHDLAIHDFAVLDRIFGCGPTLTRVTHSERPGARLSDNIIELAYRTGQTASVVVNWSGPEKIRLMHVEGSVGVLEFDELRTHQKLARRVMLGGKTGNDSGRTDIRVGIALQNERETLANAVQAFVDAVRSGNPPYSDGWQGVRLARIVDACVASKNSGGTWQRIDETRSSLAPA